jgi:hypothetical protein
MDLAPIPASSRATHVKWCNANPNRGNGVVNRPGSTACMNTPESMLKKRESIKLAHKSGKYKEAHLRAKGKPGKKHTEETKRKLSKMANASNSQRASKRVRKFTDKRGREFKFDSSWEEILAKRLDVLDIYWDRPKPILYHRNGTVRKYFADFYLPDYDIYLDPKNPWVQKMQKEKLEILHSMITLFVLSKEECEKFQIECKL